MDVAGPEAVAADDDDRVADRAPPRLEVLDVLVEEIEEVHHLVALLADVELAVVGVTVRDRFEGRADRTGGAVVLFGFGQRLAVDHVQDRIEQQEVAGAARIDHAGLLQHRELLRCSGERLTTGVACRSGHVGERADVRRIGRRLGAHPGDGQDRPLDRVPNRLVGAGGRRRQRTSQLVPADRLGRPDGGGDPPQDLAQDHPAVAPRPHQRAVADRIAGGVEVVLGRAVHLLDDGVERAGHVGAGVAVGDRVHVEPVEPVGVGSDRVAVRAHAVAQCRSRHPVQCLHDAPSYEQDRRSPVRCGPVVARPVAWCEGPAPLGAR